jgi:hypothetical protein
VELTTHSTYIKRVPKDIKNQTDLFMKQLSKTKYFIPIPDKFKDSLFFDVDHLNSNGAKKYTHLLKKYQYVK